MCSNNGTSILVENKHIWKSNKSPSQASDFLLQKVFALYKKYTQDKRKTLTKQHQRHILKGEHIKACLLTSRCLAFWLKPESG
ncbi:MAG: hypothetical protein D3916_07950 [Candidatus Electrothrix sp. MAN1_4]|nr:hypothetical protein [Candidatus Electrothrix sp. MAN1_4]